MTVTVRPTTVKRLKNYRLMEYWADANTPYYQGITPDWERFKVAGIDRKTATTNFMKQLFALSIDFDTTPSQVERLRKQYGLA